ncbi:MAG: endonuclease/exonuclease/phosphatase family protein [Flavobacteriales bacterium]|nr:endonuclease/exonuclease/phosphatase family protein [Flavobacteriales bacterium]
MKKWLKRIGLVVAIPILYVVGNLVYATLSDYSPPPQESIFISSTGSKNIGDTITILTWNIGCTGLGAETDFFYDGGKVVTQTPEIVEKNRNGIIEYLKSRRDVDIFLLQEVDSTGKRSHGFNHVDLIQEAVGPSDRAFAMNYNVDFVPVPFFDPMGKVKSGIVTLSRTSVESATRYSFDSQMKWPDRLFYLDRCFLETPIKTTSGKELTIFNTHCSAYDTAGTMVENEVELMTRIARERQASGKYVVFGGDWNQCPPNYTPIGGEKDYFEFILQAEQLDKGWKWVADPTTPTNRKLDHVYSENSYTSVIDHFAVSPNIEVLSVKTIDLDFQFSDHQPVELTIVLN